MKSHSHDDHAVLVLGESGGLSATLIQRLEQASIPVEPATSLSDSQTSTYLSERRWDAVAVVSLH